MKEMARLISGAMVQIVERYGWNRLIILADADEEFYAQVAELSFGTLLKNNRSVHYHQVHGKFNATNIVKKVVSENFYVIIIFLSSSRAQTILAERLAGGLKWPQYAWIFHSTSMDTESPQNALFEGTMELLVKNLTCVPSESSYHH